MLAFLLPQKRFDTFVKVHHVIRSHNLRLGPIYGLNWDVHLCAGENLM